MAPYRSRNDSAKNGFPLRGAPPGMAGRSGIVSTNLPSTSPDWIVSAMGARDWLGMICCFISAVAVSKEGRKSELESTST